jgi:hypothetical protein
VPTPLDPTLAVEGSASPGGVTHIKGAGCRPDSEVRVALDAAHTGHGDRGGRGAVPRGAQDIGRHPAGSAHGDRHLHGSDGSELTQTASLEIVPAEPQPTETNRRGNQGFERGFTARVAK